MHLPEHPGSDPPRVPGGLAGAILVGMCPALLLGFALVHGQSEQILGMNGLVFGALLIAGGFFVYFAKSAVEKKGWVAAALRNQRKAA